MWLLKECVQSAMRRTLKYNVDTKSSGDDDGDDDGQ